MAYSVFDDCEDVDATTVAFVVVGFEFCTLDNDDAGFVATAFDSR